MCSTGCTRIEVKFSSLSIIQSFIVLSLFVIAKCSSQCCNQIIWLTVIVLFVNFIVEMGNTKNSFYITDSVVLHICENKAQVMKSSSLFINIFYACREFFQLTAYCFLFQVLWQVFINDTYKISHNK